MKSLSAASTLQCILCARRCLKKLAPRYALSLELQLWRTCMIIYESKFLAQHMLSVSGNVLSLNFHEENTPAPGIDWSFKISQGTWYSVKMSRTFTQPSPLPKCLQEMADVFEPLSGYWVKSMVILRVIADKRQWLRQNANQHITVPLKIGCGMWVWAT